MTAPFPFAQIVFFLAVIFLPQGAFEFSADIDGYELIWTRHEDAWQAASAGRDGGPWSVKGFEVTGFGETTSLGSLVKVETDDAGKKNVSVKDKPVSVAITEPSISASRRARAPPSARSPFHRRKGAPWANPL